MPYPVRVRLVRKTLVRSWKGKGTTRNELRLAVNLRLVRKDRRRAHDEAPPTCIMAGRRSGASDQSHCDW